MPWLWFRRAAPEDPIPRQSRLQAVLVAASRSKTYRATLRCAGLEVPLRPLSTSGQACLLEHVPVTRDPALSFLAADRLRQQCPGNFLPRLFWPVPRPARTAILMDGFQEDRSAQIFQPRDWTGLRRFGPDALAGPVGALRSLAENPQARSHLSPFPSHSILVLLTFRQAGVSEETRDLLWRAFGVPLYAQILSPARHLMAWECEAHEGFHVAEENALFELDYFGGAPELIVTSLADLSIPVLRVATGLTARIERSRCACGLFGLRLLELRVRPQPVSRAERVPAARGSMAHGMARTAMAAAGGSV